MGNFPYKWYRAYGLGVVMTKFFFVSLFVSDSLCTSLAEWHHPAVNQQLEFHVDKSATGSLLIFNRQLEAAHPSNLITYGTTLRENEKPRR